MDFLFCSPDWDLNTDQGKKALNNSFQGLLEGLKAADRKPTNLSKVREVIQDLQESPAGSWTTSVRHTLDLDTPEKQTAINIAFVIQLFPDIRKKLQKLEGFEGMNRSQLLEIAQKVYNNCDSIEEKQSKRLT